MEIYRNVSVGKEPPACRPKNMISLLNFIHPTQSHLRPLSDEIPLDGVPVEGHEGKLPVQLGINSIQFLKAFHGNCDNMRII